MANQQYDVEADFVVVGAGSAGCVMATRLSEDPSTRVVLLEAGGEDRNRWIHIPLGYGKTFADASVNWCYQAEPDPGANGRSIFWPRGKVLGGSSSINGMVYIRGQHEDFDLWRQLGNAGWSSTDVLPYFKRAQHQVRGADEFHGTGGPLCVSDTSEHHPICEAFIKGAMELGYPRNDDFNGASRTVSATIRRPRATASAAPRRSATCTLCATGPTFGSSPARWPRRCCSTAGAPSASHSAKMASRAPCEQPAK